MNIILVSNHMAKARSLSLWQVLAALAALLIVPPLLTAALILPQPAGAHQGVQALLPVRLMQTVRDNSQAHLDGLALQLGQIQARVMRLDALNDRLAKLAGFNAEDLESTLPPPGQGGPLLHQHNLSAEEISQQLEQLTRQLEQRSDGLGVLEALLLQRKLGKDTLPDQSPVNTAYTSSSFGWRNDPFTGEMALHEGLDFTAQTGTPIHAAAGGIVIEAASSPDYGNIVKLDHGAGLETRYAHISRFLVKPGERVEKGQLIAEVGNTGRSTGAHLHFEVRLNGVALDPRKYLQQPDS